MTGKEALEYIANLLFMFTSTGRHSGKNYTLKALCKIEDELDELTKYKRALEILKEKLDIRPMKNDKECWFYFRNTWRNEDSVYMDLTDKEYELLEELIND